MGRSIILVSVGTAENKTDINNFQLVALYLRNSRGLIRKQRALENQSFDIKR